VDERKVAGLGMDTLSIDPGIAREFPAHRVVLKAEAINIENLANLGQVPAHGAVLVVAPLRIANGSGAPARVFALVPKGSLPRQP
jgi:kynurenine formamidase